MREPQLCRHRFRRRRLDCPRRRRYRLADCQRGLRSQRRMQLTAVEDCPLRVLIPVVWRRPLACPYRMFPAPHPGPRPPIELKMDPRCRHPLPRDPVIAVVDWHQRCCWPAPLPRRPPPVKWIVTVKQTLMQTRIGIPARIAIDSARWVWIGLSMKSTNWSFALAVAAWTAWSVGWAASCNLCRPARLWRKWPGGEA